MSPSLQKQVLRITNDLKDITDCNNRHFSFLVDKSRIVSIGWNTRKTHPKSLYYNYRFNGTHSELAALLKYRGRNPKNLTLINTRINGLGEIGFSKPCEKCLPWLIIVGFKSIWYTERSGKFVRLE